MIHPAVLEFVEPGREKVTQAGLKAKGVAW
jgi:hypothetical protein